MSKKYSTIAIDLDDVIVETASKVIEHYNIAYGTKVQLKDYYSNDYKKTWRAPDIHTAIKRVNSYIDTDEYLNSEPIQHAIEIIRQLEKKYKLYIITGRPDFTELVTREWLQKHFPDLFKDIIFSNFYDPGKKRHKGEICIELGVNLLIDDHPDHILSASQDGIDGFLFGDLPWTRKLKKLPENVRRVKSWDKVAELLL